MVYYGGKGTLLWGNFNKWVLDIIKVNIAHHLARGLSVYDVNVNSLSSSV